MRTVRDALRAANDESGWAKIVSLHSSAQRFSNAANTSSPVARSLRVSARGLRVIGSSEQVHVVDALAITGDEGRRSLR